MNEENKELEAELSLSAQLNAKGEDEVAKDFETHLAEGLEGDKPEEPKEEEDPSQEGENTPDEPKEKPEADVPFHKHPRFQQLVKERDQEREAREALEARLSELETKQVNSQPKSAPPEFVHLFGDNPDFYQEFSRLTQAEAKKIVDERMSQLERERQEADNKQKQATEFIEKSLAELADETGIDLTNPKCSERNEIMDIAVKYRPIDDQGNIDMRKSYDLWKQIKPKKDDTIAKKQLASSTMDKTKKVEMSGEKSINFGDLRGKSVHDFIK